MSIKESDWKVFCEIKKEAIQLFCTRQLNEVIKTITDESELAGERFHFMCRYRKDPYNRPKLSASQQWLVTLIMLLLCFGSFVIVYFVSIPKIYW
ncbi:hypothetical protein AB4520_05580 [Vibrio renipiscarius]|uniref:hypothetical protein n=1 Tax=Vibrio renipiscarius TaxID=1461322 RepID=UPI0035519669